MKQALIFIRKNPHLLQKSNVLRNLKDELNNKAEKAQKEYFKNPSLEKSQKTLKANDEFLEAVRILYKEKKHYSKKIDKI